MKRKNLLTGCGVAALALAAFGAWNIWGCAT